MPDMIAAVGKLMATDLKPIVTAVADAVEYIVWQTETGQEIELFTTEHDPARYDDAYAFGPGAQLHWQQETWLTPEGPGTGWRVVYTGEVKHCPAVLSNSQTKIDLAPPYQVAEIVVKLWGARRDGQDTWLEPRIPRRLDYPYQTQATVAPPQRLGMKVKQYLWQGQVAYYRITGLVPWALKEASQ